MDDLISRQEAIDALIDRFADEDSPCIEYMVYWDHGMVIDTLKKVPSAQPEIIRCKECKHWDTSWQNDYAPNYHYCPLVDGTRRDDFYCADAERREDGTD